MATATETRDDVVDDASVETTVDESGKESGKTGSEKMISQSQHDAQISALREKWDSEAEEKQLALADEAKAAEKLKAGKFEELFKDEQIKSKRLEAEKKASKFTTEATEALVKAGVPEFAEVLLTPATTAAEVLAKAETIREMINAQAQGEVVERLESPDRAHVTKTKDEKPKKMTDMTSEEWTQYKKDNNVY